MAVGALLRAGVVRVSSQMAGRSSRVGQNAHPGSDGRLVAVRLTRSVPAFRTGALILSIGGASYRRGGSCEPFMAARLSSAMPGTRRQLQWVAAQRAEGREGHHGMFTPGPCTRWVGGGWVLKGFADQAVAWVRQLTAGGRARTSR